VNDVPVRENDDLILAVSVLAPGSRARLRYARGTPASTATVTVTLAKLWVPGQGIVTAGRRYFRGLRVDYTSTLVRPPLVDEETPSTRGVVVCEVQSGGPADRSGLKPGEIITRVNGKPVPTPEDFYKLMQGLEGSVELTLAAERGKFRKVKIN